MRFIHIEMIDELFADSMYSASLNEMILPKTSINFLQLIKHIKRDQHIIHFIFESYIDL